MSSKILPSATPTLAHGTTNGTMGDMIFSSVKSHHERDKASQLGIYENHYQNQRHNPSETAKNIAFDVSNSECIYGQQPKSNAGVSVENLIPQAAKLILTHAPKNRSDFVDQERSDSDDYDYVVTDDTDSEPEPNIPPPDYDNYADDRDSYGEYGLEVIQEETESQMSSDSDQELDQHDFCEENSPSRRKSSEYDTIDHVDHFGVFGGESSEVLTFPHEEEAGNSDSKDVEIVTKHIRISGKDFDPDPILKRLFFIEEPHQTSPSNSNEIVAGHINLLSGNRKKGTFWNAWRKKYFVITPGSGYAYAYEKDDCKDLFQSIQLVGGKGKVDFLDPVEYVGPEQGKTMTNRMIGVDDGKGHYFVLLCTSSDNARRWVAALEQEMASTFPFAVPILPKSPSLFRDVIVVDLGSSNIRAGVLTHQPTLPALFFASVMSENLKSGKRLYGNDVYKPEYRKNAKITFPFECTSKMCQNTIEVSAVQGFMEKIFKDLCVRPENYRLILIIPRRVENKCRQSLLELLFNTFQIRSVMIAHQSVVSFWAYSTNSGICIDIGERCDIVPVSQGFILTQAWTRAPYGGQPLKHSLRQGLGPEENGIWLDSPRENVLLRFISENFVCVSSTGSRRPSQDSQEIVVEMDLRDVLWGELGVIGVNQNVLRGVAEGFFDPGFYGLDCDSLQKLVLNCLQNCGVDIRKEMSQNILLSGGCTLIPGFPERLENELAKICPPHLKPKVHVSPYRYHGSFIGASVLATTEAFEKSLLNRSKYDGGPGPAYWMI